MSGLSLVLSIAMLRLFLSIEFLKCLYFNELHLFDHIKQNNAILSHVV